MLLLSLSIEKTNTKRITPVIMYNISTSIILKCNYKAVKNVKNPSITPVALGIIRIISFLGSFVQP